MKMHFKLIFIPFLLLFIVVLLRVDNKDKNCHKWLYLTSTKQRVNDVAGAIKVLSPVLKTENKYKNYDLPGDPDGFLKKYNILPYKRTETVMDKSGRFVRKEVFDMLLAYVIDSEGNVYKYNMCRTI
ncbi:hypothetical protein A3J20_05150 [Candidatus Gottesmanbacteria bacterium RIFCSPLOWO2_02_FULL_42_29]|uniref:Uncharacterized protein n=2 Tax=Candidatus Gottesmaniibacteriota TaxID=1752720 RepID=A0A1F6BHM9_9BACT|nr:MAG: hypothetical protein A2781_00080 [Candidatus Gottesmanbacteria bacterium RIFCSPHIGHO2_01_FULL_42_27]OGG21189.1 MAG: hypothetical protein A3E72_03780 [Candidatus Gottesmanbacteria bacterium RIFCSPHIGHO2_12_FULL_43_26]OGG33934.1 MAG: hypothetical protein A3G68_00200 [Candidatus Gottesmanbacteria bacterium RIFCSPLOWO2_12_FULL_42_10]OGG36292.1 MAG: hypothetical protein A2968_06275 [Candidatus Gottesmanbacteria bacterium RIFCSPLOWO2_01_FULL_42_22]OGG37031.1 MAG: hypothetical protein A3J20_05